MRSRDFQSHYFVIRCHPSFFGVTMKPFMSSALAAEQPLRICIQHESKTAEAVSSQCLFKPELYTHTGSFSAREVLGVSVIPTGSLLSNAWFCFASFFRFILCTPVLFRGQSGRVRFHSTAKVGHLVKESTLRRPTCSDTNPTHK